MKNLKSYAELIPGLSAGRKSFLLLYKSGSEQSTCAKQNFESSLGNNEEISLYLADVNDVKDIHSRYGISTVPSLLIFEHDSLVSVVKGCQTGDFYKALAGNNLYRAQNGSEEKLSKKVTVYSTPTCTWCNTLKTWLKKNHISFTDVDLSRDQKAAEDLVRRSGQQGVPQTDINGQIIVGFDQPKLKQLLGVQ